MRSRCGGRRPARRRRSRARARTRARAASCGSTRRGAARLRAGAGPARRPLGGSHRKTLADDLPRERPALVVARHREHGAGVALGERAALDEVEHVVRQLEQSQTVRHGRLRAADPLGELAERERELVLEKRVGACLLDRREILACDVLDEREDQRLAVVGLADERRDRREPRRAGRPPAALAGDELLAPVAERVGRAPAGRPLRAHGLRQAAQRSASIRLRGWRGLGGSGRPGAARARPGRPRRPGAPRGRGRGRGATARWFSATVDELAGDAVVGVGAGGGRVVGR